LGEKVMARIGFGRKLGKERGKEAIAVLLLRIPKIEIIVGHCGQSGCSHALDVLDDCGAS
jgi:hypothetical protein